jgi:hypothetical protein
MINGVGVATPDQERWQPNVIGDAVAGTQRRSPYDTLVWRRRVSGPCDLDWLQYDNTILATLVTRPDGELRQHTSYDDVICKSVNLTMTLGVITEITATFLVYTGG